MLSLTSKLAETQIKLNQLDSASETLAGVDVNFEQPFGHIAGIIHYCTTQHQLLLRYGKSVEARVWARRISEIHESKVAEIIGYGSERQRWASSTVKPVYGFWLIVERQKYWLSICCGQKDGFGLQKNGFVGRSILRIRLLRHYAIFV